VGLVIGAGLVVLDWEVDVEGPDVHGYVCGEMSEDDEVVGGDYNWAAAFVDELYYDCFEEDGAACDCDEEDLE
jgi:hypothetical protein